MAAFKHTPKQLTAVACIVKHQFAMLVGGAGSGKTFLALRAIIIRALKAPNSRHLILRSKFAHAKASIWHESLPEVMEKCFPDIPYIPNKAEFYLPLPNGSSIWIGGIDDKKRIEKVLGRSLATIYINEASQVNAEGFLMLRTRLRQKNDLIKLKFLIDCNPPNKSHWTYKYFVQKVDINGIALENPENYGFVLMNPKDNQDNLPEEYLKDLQALPGKYRKRFWEGEFTDDTEGAIFQQSWIDENRSIYKTYEDFYKHESKYIIRSVVAIDPATKDKEESDETGIVGACSTRNYKSTSTDFHVLADRSGHYSPNNWAKAAIILAEEIEADCIVIETNQGGDMATNTLRMAGYKGKIAEVHTKRSKKIRADPVSALYEQGFVKHLQSLDLAKLEEQLTSYVPHLFDASPDRLDANVYAITYLAENSTHGKGFSNMSAQNFKNNARKYGWK